MRREGRPQNTLPKRRLGRLGLVVAFAAVACGSAEASTGVMGTAETRPATESVVDFAAAPFVNEPTAPTTTAPPPTTVAPTTTAPPLASGVVDVRYTVNGIERSAVVVNPPANGKPRALVVLLHGVGGRGAAMRSFGFEALATGSTVFAYPDGVGGFWNDGRPGLDPTPAPAPPEEIRFLSTLIDDLVARAGVAKGKVALAGFSNGAIMAARASCELSDRVAAVIAVGGGGGADYNQVCQPRQALSVLVVAGTSDPIVPFNGGQVADFQGKKRGRVESANDFFAFWSARGGCTGTVDTPIKATLAVVQTDAQACTARTFVSMYRVQGGSHDWFRMSGFDTTKVAWDFLNTKALAG